MCGGGIGLMGCGWLVGDDVFEYVIGERCIFICLLL